MASIFNNFSYLSRLLLAVNSIGRTFLNLREFTTVVERYVFGSTIEGVIETANASDEAARKLVKSRVEIRLRHRRAAREFPRGRRGNNMASLVRVVVVT